MTAKHGTPDSLAFNEKMISNKGFPATVTKRQRSFTDVLRPSCADDRLRWTSRLLGSARDGHAVRRRHSRPQYRRETCRWRICSEEGVAKITSNPFGAKNLAELQESEQVEWCLWALFGVKECGLSAEAAYYHLDRNQSRGWTLTEWYGDDGDLYRKGCGLGAIPQADKDNWHAFLESNRERTLDDINEEIRRLDEARIASRPRRKVRRLRRVGR